MFEVYGREGSVKLLVKKMPPLQDVGAQKCLAFSVDGSRFAAGGVVSILYNILEYNFAIRLVSVIKSLHSINILLPIKEKAYIASAYHVTLFICVFNAWSPIWTT